MPMYHIPAEAFLADRARLLKLAQQPVLAEPFRVVTEGAAINIGSLCYAMNGVTVGTGPTTLAARVSRAHATEGSLPAVIRENLTAVIASTERIDQIWLVLKPIVRNGEDGRYLCVNRVMNAVHQYTTEPRDLPILAQRETVAVVGDGAFVRWASFISRRCEDSTSMLITPNGVVPLGPPMDPEERLPYTTASDGGERTSYYWNHRTQKIIKLNSACRAKNHPIDVLPLRPSGLKAVLGEYLNAEFERHYDIIVIDPAMGNDVISERCRRRVFLPGESDYVAGVRISTVSSPHFMMRRDMSPLHPGIHFHTISDGVFLAVAVQHNDYVSTDATRRLGGLEGTVLTDADGSYFVAARHNLFNPPPPAVAPNRLGFNGEEWLSLEWRPEEPVEMFGRWTLTRLGELFIGRLNGDVVVYRDINALRTAIWTGQEELPEVLIDWATGARTTWSDLSADEIRMAMENESIPGAEYLNGRWYRNVDRSTGRAVCDGGATTLEATAIIPPCESATVCPCCRREVDGLAFDTPRRIIMPGGETITGNVCNACLRFFDPTAFRAGTLPHTPWSARLNRGIQMCSDCGVLVANGSARTVGDVPICPACIEANYCSCSQCGVIEHHNNMNENDVCPRCTGARAELLNYSYQIPIVMHRVRPAEELFFGVEIEMENQRSSGSRSSTATKAFTTLAYPACRNFMFAKHDGSLSDGAEFVSQPFSWDWFRENKQFWEDFFGRAKDRGFGAASSCGLHIHVSRAPHTSLHEFRLFHLLYNLPNTDFWYKACARDGNMSYCSLRAGNTQNPATWAAVARTRSTFGNRYLALNPTGKDTLEWRLWRGVDTYADFASALALTAAAHDFVRSGGGVKPSTDKLCKFVEEHHEYHCRAKPRLDLGKGLRRRG